MPDPSSELTSVVVQRKKLAIAFHESIFACHRSPIASCEKKSQTPKPKDIPLSFSVRGSSIQRHPLAVQSSGYSSQHNL